MAHGQSSSSDLVAPRSRFYQGPYGRLFDELPPWRPVGADGIPLTDNAQLEAFCLEIANTRMIEVAPGGVPVPPNEFDEVAADTKHRSIIPAGYTYFGQFVDHDITFDPASSLLRINDPNKLFNFRTPRLDLDNLYGRGPDDQPYLYSRDPGPAKFLTGTIPESTLRDLPRNSTGHALIGDPRNDENSIVSQLHLAFLQAHNTLVDRAVDQGAPDPFTAARTALRWLYQWIVWHDFIDRIVEGSVHQEALQRSTTPSGRVVWKRGLTDVYDWHDQPFMPVEFSGAAYRFGHSMVRSKYKTNIRRGAGDDDFVPIFDNTPGSTGDNLRGFRPLDRLNAIQWDWYLQMQSSREDFGFPQRARRIDTKLTNALAFLHEGDPGVANNVLASRNLLRGIALELPGGPDVARRLGMTPINVTAAEPKSLWFYILKEAATTTGGERLGLVGSTIVAAVFAGLLEGDPQCWINVAPAWTPDTEPLLLEEDNADSTDGSWGLPAIIRIAGAPVDGDDFPAL